MDEFVCEIITDGPDTFWWALQDPNYNVVALVSDGDGSGGASSGGTYRGEVARQYSWSPYGELLRADIYDTSAPMSRLGHQGLFHDRLDADILSEPMVAFSDQTVQNRNRTLSPRLGRFLQRDPNASGLTIFRDLAQFGARPSPDISDPSAGRMFDDGMSLFGYLGSSPTTSTDPTGLFIMGMMFGMGEAGSINADYNDNVTDVAGSLTELLTTGFAAYGAGQESDLEWALDWSAGDRDYMASGAAAAGLAGFGFTRPSISGLPTMIANENGVKIMNYSNDHKPAHVDVREGKRHWRVGENGKPLGDEELSPKAKKVVNKHKKEIRQVVNKLRRYYKYEALLEIYRKKRGR